MTRFGWLVLSGFVIAALGIALLIWGFARQSAPLSPAENQTPVVDYSTLNIHANGEYGFSIQYPASAQVQDAIPADDERPWRANAVAPGTLIVRFMTAGGEVRVGASSDPKALEACKEPGPSEEAGEQVTFGEETWNLFSFDELGTDDERRVTSYRALHDGRCFAVEAFKPYAVAAEIAPTEDVEFIARSFTFAR